MKRTPRPKWLKETHLEGSWEQIVFNVPRGDARNDTMRYYELGGGKGRHC